LWDSQAGTLLVTLEGHSEQVHNVIFSPDGQRLASASVDGRVCLWDSQAGTLLATIEGESLSTGMSFANSSTLYVHITRHSPSVSGLLKVKLTGQPLSPTEAPICWFPSNWQVSKVAFNSTFSIAAVGCENGKLYLLDISAFKEL
jgi:WD40 repeat protein